jgi:hypothetical protein
MKKIILTLMIMFSTICVAGQSKDPKVEFDLHRNLYRVTTDVNNYHYVDEKGTINGPFKFTSNNIVIKGNMVNGKRHGTVTTLIDNQPDVIVEYDMGRPVTYTKVLR